MGFLLALSALSITAATAATEPAPQTIEARLSRLTAAVRERAEQVPPSSESDRSIALGWADGRGRRGWVNGRVGGWGNGYRGGFANVNPWRNGWRDGGFFNSNPWRNGGFSNFRNYR
jgi:rSAM-associated Gly-rich repeat protein